MTRNSSQVEVAFQKHNHYWLDVGLIGLYTLLGKGQNDHNIVVSLSDDKLVLIGTTEEIKNALQDAYNLLIDEHYDVSTDAQRSNQSSYNFYYDSAKKEFIRFPKKASVGLAKLIYNKAARPTKGKINWVKTEEKKKCSGILPSDHANLQAALEEFLKATGLKITMESLLIDGPYEVRPKMEIDISGKKLTGERCFLCGEEGSKFRGINETVYPFITGDSGVLSFNSTGGKPARVCWKCDLLGKFVPVVAFYLEQDKKLYAFLPYSTSLTVMQRAYEGLRLAYKEDPNRHQNFYFLLGSHATFKRSSEALFAFLYTVFRKLQSGNASQQPNPSDLQLLFGPLAKEFVSSAPLEFVILQAFQKGSTMMGENFWVFRDSIYFFRLIAYLESKGINLEKVMSILIDRTQELKDQTIIRDRICERILKKQSVLGIVETFISRPDNKSLQYIAPLVDLVCAYEPIIRTKGGSMTNEDQDVAVTLGKRIGWITVALQKRDKKNPDKSSLYALRRVRKKTDFLNELNRLQFKYGLVVPPEVYGGSLTDENFPEFKGFCLIAALNSFGAASADEKKTDATREER